MICRVACAVLLFALFAAPLLADSPERVVRVGLVNPGSRPSSQNYVPAIWQRLRELGWIEGRNLVIEERWADGDLGRLRALMYEVVERRVDVLVTNGTPAAIAAKRATSTVPIVIAAMGDPIQAGLAVSLSRPGGNLTGLSLAYGEGLAGKWLELLQETMPGTSKVAVISQRDSPLLGLVRRQLEAAAVSRGLKLRFIEIRTPGDFDRAFAQARQAARTVIVLPDPAAAHDRPRVVALANQHRLAAVYGLLEFVEAGGLLSYGPNMAASFRRAAEYVDKILRGASPAHLPIEQAREFSLAVNLKTARALSLTIPDSILLRADEVIR